jgi:hypothetical protein
MECSHDLRSGAPLACAACYQFRRGEGLWSPTDRPSCVAGRPHPVGNCSEMSGVLSLKSPDTSEQSSMRSASEGSGADG